MPIAGELKCPGAEGRAEPYTGASTGQRPRAAQDSFLSQAFAKIGQRQNELPRIRAQRDETVVLVECHGLTILAESYAARVSPPRVDPSTLRDSAKPRDGGVTRGASRPMPAGSDRRPRPHRDRNCRAAAIQRAAGRALVFGRDAARPHSFLWDQGNDLHSLRFVR